MLFLRHNPARVSSTARRPRPSVIGCERLEGRALLSSLTQDVQALVQELSTLHKGSNVTPAEVQAVTADVKAIAAVATKPSAGSVAALKAEIGVVVANGAITPAETVVLKKDVTAVLTSANIPTSLADQTFADIKAVITSSGVTRADVKTVLADVEAIAADLGSLKK